MHKHTDLRAQDFAQPPDLWHQPRLVKVTCHWSWRLCELNVSVPTPDFTVILRYKNTVAGPSGRAA